MKFSSLKTGVGLSVVGAAVIFTTACSGASPAEAGLEQVVPVKSPVAVAAVKANVEPALLEIRTSHKSGPENEPATKEHSPKASVVAVQVSNIPRFEVLPRATALTTIKTKLKAGTQAANVRSGPGLEFEVLDVIDNTQTIVAKGRAQNSNWLQLEHNDELAWLAGDLIAHQYLIDTLPVVKFEPAAEIGVAESAQVEAAQPQVEAAQPQVEAAQPQVEAAQPVGCNARPIRGFGETWDNYPEVRELLGCPFTNFRRDEHATPAAVQIFERGWMLWLETDTVANVDPIYVFFEDDHSYIRYGDRQLVDAHSYAPTPRGYYKVGDRFAKVYWEELNHQQRARLGFAINEARDSNGAFQEFENGRMFWAGEADTIYTIFQGYFDINSDGQPIWTQGWMAYEDTFEAPAEE